jgi:hypothetical protein
VSEGEDDALEALYTVSLEGFIGARKELAARVKKSGDAAKAKAIAALPKPTASAWVTNELHRSVPREMDELIEVGARLRAAMRAALSSAGTAADVTKLQRAQRDLVEALVEVASEHLAKNELPKADAVLARVRTNLTTLSTSGAWGESAPGRLSKDLEPLDMASLAVLLDVAETPRKAAAEPPPAGMVEAPALDKAAQVAEARRAAHEAAERARAEASSLVDQAKKVADDARAHADRAVSSAERTRSDATTKAARVEELERALRLAREEADSTRRAADTEAGAAERAKQLADRALRDLERAESKLATATEALAKLEGGVTP